MEASEKQQLDLAGDRLEERGGDGTATGAGSVRAVEDRLVIEELTIADERAARVVRERAKSGTSPVDTVTKAVEIGTRVIDDQGTAANVDYVRRELQSGLGELGKELEGALDSGSESLAEQIASAFGADRSDSVQNQIREIVSKAAEHQRLEITRMLAAEDKSNPLVAVQARLGKAMLESEERHRQEMQRLRESHSGESRALQRQVGELKEHLARLLDQQAHREDLAEAEEAGTRKGRSFEDRAFAAVERIAAARGDAAKHVGDEPGAGGSKKGDIVVEIGAAEGPPDGSIVIEVKDSQLSKPKAWEELNGAMSARGADFAILLVAGEESIPARQEQLHEYEGNKLIVAVDPDDPDELGLELAYRFARCRVLLRREDELTVDAVGVRAAAAEARAALGEARNVKSALTTARNSVEKARTGVETIESAVLDRIARIESLIAAADSEPAED